MQGLSSRYPPGPTPRMGESLRFRQIAFAPPQRFFRLLALCDVRRATHEFHQIPGGVQDSVAAGWDVFNGAAWKNDSEFHSVTRLFRDCSIDCVPPLGSILGM